MNTVKINNLLTRTVNYTIGKNTNYQSTKIQENSKQTRFLTIIIQINLPFNKLRFLSKTKCY